MLLMASLCLSSAFLSPQSHLTSHSRRQKPISILSPAPHPSPIKPSNIRHGTTALPSLFGLGPGELAIIALAGLLVIGPTKLTEMSRQAGKELGKSAEGLKEGAKGLKEGGVPEEWKAIPGEFKKGLEEGEIEARGRKAKMMDSVDE